MPQRYEDESVETWRQLIDSVNRVPSTITPSVPTKVAQANPSIAGLTPPKVKE